MPQVQESLRTILARNGLKPDQVQVAEQAQELVRVPVQVQEQEPVRARVLQPVHYRYWN